MERDRVRREMDTCRRVLVGVMVCGGGGTCCVSMSNEYKIQINLTRINLMSVLTSY